MGRMRTRGTSYGPLAIQLGTQYYDLTVPYGNGPWVYPTNKVWTLYSPVKLTDEKTLDELHPGPPFREGGPFSNWTYSTDQYTVKAFTDTSYSTTRYVGGHLPTVWPSSKLAWGSLTAFESADPGDPSSYGATGWNKFRPTRSGAELGIFLGEIKDVPRMLKTTASGFHNLWRAMGGSKTNFGPKSVANHWLNTQFGWSPFLSDLRKFHKTTSDISRKLQQLRRDNGRWIRRSGTVAVEMESTEGENTNLLYPSLPTSLYNTPYGYHRWKVQTTYQTWFEGAFRYWIPGKPDDWQWDARALAQIYGLQPSPSLVWELTPWSWLIDWCSNVGDVMANVSSMLFDNLCARYAFIMGNYRHRADVEGYSNYKTAPATGSWYAQLESKSRVAASPFGFGLTGADFSTRQWSILGALGISRTRSF